MKNIGEKIFWASLIIGAAVMALTLVITAWMTIVALLNDLL